MEKIIAHVLKRQRLEGDYSKATISKDVSQIETSHSTAGLHKRKKPSKVSFMADQNWLVIREKLASNPKQENRRPKSYTSRLKNKVESGLRKSHPLPEETTSARLTSGMDVSQQLHTGGMTKTVELSSSNKSPRVTNVVALDCEFVGVGKLGKEHSLARVSIVNFKGEVLYDKYVMNDRERIVDFRTSVSGIRPEHLRSPEAVSFEQAQKDVHSIIRDRILVGHAIHHDMHALLLSHPRKLIRDTSKWRGLRSPPTRKTPSLRKLAQEILGMRIQEGEHDSVEDARATLMIYKRFAKQWEKELQTKRNGKSTGKKQR